VCGEVIGRRCLEHDQVAEAGRILFDECLNSFGLCHDLDVIPVVAPSPLPGHC
jgi:hypothetical protein